MSAEASKKVNSIIYFMHEQIDIYGETFLSVFDQNTYSSMICKVVYKLMNSEKDARKIVQKIGVINKKKEQLDLLSNEYRWFTASPSVRQDAIKEKDDLINKIREVSNLESSGSVELEEIQSFLYANNERVDKHLNAISKGNYVVLPADFNRNDISDLKRFEDSLILKILSADQENRRVVWSSMDLFEWNRMIDKDFYYEEDIVPVIEERCGVNKEKDQEALLSLMGFHKNAAGAYYLRGYESLFDYMYDEMSKQEIVSQETYKTKYKGNYLVEQVISSLQHDMKLFEFDEGQYISILRLNKLKITSEDIENYLAEIKALSEKQKFFNYSSIRKYLNDLRICNLGFDDRFYDQIIRNSGDYLHLNMYSNIIFTKEDIELSRQVFLKYVLERFGSMYLDDFIEFIKDTFQMNISKNYLLSDIKGTDIYYDKIMDKIYKDYDQYYDEI
nr:hypothetical protein [Clostridia bacterium]